MFFRHVEMNTIRNYKIPKLLIGQNTLEILIENMKKMDTEQQKTKPQNMFFIKIANVILAIGEGRFKQTF